MFRHLIAFALLAGLAACGGSESQLKFGAKNFGESRILAQMMSEVAIAQGLPVAGVVDYETTQAIQEALKRGDIDAYPEYNGTGLVMLGQNPMTDGDAAMARVKEIYEPLGLSWRPRFGFANNYGLAMRPERAAELGVDTISELVSRAGALVLGVEDDFTRRPLDGLQPLVQRYGLNFAATEEVPLADRAQLYDKLLDGEVDVIEVYTTDGQLADYGLTLLTDDQRFFPVYEAAVLARASSLSAHEGLGGALDSLAGKIDAATMQDLNRKVDIEGRDPRAVARDALARFGLIDSGSVETAAPLMVAASPLLNGGGAANAALRAARNAFRGQEIVIDPSEDPLGEVASGKARLALVGADAFFDASSPAPVRNDAFEAVAVIGQNLVHVITAQGGPTRLADVKTVAAGPAGTSSHRLAQVLVSGLSLGAEIRTGGADSAEALAKQVVDGSADAAVIAAPQGDGTVVAAFNAHDLRLLSVNDWSEGANLVRFPFLRQSSIAAGTYRGQFSAVETIGAQLVLAGPAPVAGDVVGDQGPSAINTKAITPISDDAVAALNQAAPGVTLIDPTLRQAAALSPALPEPPAAISPSADISILNLVLIAFFVWVAWLYIRPEYR